MSFSDSEDEVPCLINSNNDAVLLEPAFDDEEEPSKGVKDASDNTQPSTSSARVPLTIISGFLGAGKSTLLKRILTERHGYRIAVIMNEFGDTADIEAKTINVSSSSDPMAENTEEFLELANGCLCCSIKDTGVAAIEKLMQKKGAFDYILLETTGLADPGPIASMFWQNEEYATGLADIILDSVVCVVDAVFGQQQMQEDHAIDDLEIGESLRQIAASDIILLNKVDLASPSSLAETEALIRQINPVAPLYQTIKGEIDLKHIIGISAFRKPPPSGTTSSRSTKDHIHTEECRHDESGGPSAPATHYELRGISSLQVRCPGLLSQLHLETLDEWIRLALWENRVRTPPPDSQNAHVDHKVQILRCKGAFRDEKGAWHVLQGVRNVYEIVELEEGEEQRNEASVDIPDSGKIVLIGKGLNESVKRSLQSIFDVIPQKI